MFNKRSFVVGIAFALLTASCTEDVEPLAIADIPSFDEIEPGTYFLDQDNDPETPLRITFKVESEGWRSWVGTYKPEVEGGPRAVAVTVASPTEVITDPCHNRAWRDPGPSVDDFAGALVDLPGMVVTEPLSDVKAFGYEGKHLVLQIPGDIQFDPTRGFVGCNESSFFGWRAGEIGRPERVLTRYYQAPGQTLEFWVLDVEGTVLLIERSSYADSPPVHVAELDSVIDTLRIET